MNDSYQHGSFLELVQPVRALVATNVDTHRSLVARTSMCGWGINQGRSQISHSGFANATQGLLCKYNQLKLENVKTNQLTPTCLKGVLDGGPRLSEVHV